MDLNYKKHDNRTLFSSLEENLDVFGIMHPQNYIPIYDRFFSLTETNHNNIILNHNYWLNTLKSKETPNIYQGTVFSEKDQREKKKIFLKFSPLMDPLKYLIGKYDNSNIDLLNLPSYTNTKKPHSKMKDNNNSAYVDGFFTYLSSQLLHNHRFLNGLDYYGSFLAIKKDFRFDISDDIDYLHDSNFFYKNNGIIYELEDESNDKLMNYDTRNYKKKLNFKNETDNSSNINNDDNKNTILNLSDITDLKELDNMFSNNILTDTSLLNVDDNNNNTTTTTIDAIEPELLYEGNIKISKNNSKSSMNLSSTSSMTDSSCSSRSSNTDDDNEDDDGACGSSDDDGACGSSDDDDGACGGSDDNDDHDGGNSGDDSKDDDYTDCSELSEEDESIVFAKIKQFPVQVISLEKCEDTLDNLINDNDISTQEWESMVIQILFTLITFQKAFELTHNDLHTNNIMYIKTDKTFIYYKFNHIYYKVPTFGRIFKIIDFGRAIYKFRGQLMCSDSYHPKGDAATQYNCEPYYNDKKPRLEPNYSFDLCRLGVALYDFVYDMPKTKITQIIMNWCNDDKGRNILYKKNGDERYPDFKLYKMIARTVHGNIPSEILNNDVFNKFIVSKKETNKKKNASIVNIDEIPCYI